MDKIKIGLYGIGLDTYWDQFKGLKERLEKYQDNIGIRMEKYSPDIEIINTGIIDNFFKAREAGNRLAKEGVNAIFLYISTYALSSTVLPVVQEVNVPVIVLSLQPESAIDYQTFNALGDRGIMTGEWLAYCQACSAPEIANVFNRTGIDYHLITGTLDDPEAWNEISNWIDAIRTMVMLRNTNIGLLGHYYGGMMDVYSDITKLASVFGSHFEIMEMGELVQYWKNIASEQIEKKIEQFHKDFIVDRSCSDEEIVRAAKTSIVLDLLVMNHRLGCMAYYYEGAGDRIYEDIITSVIPGNTLLTMHGVPVAGEYEVKNIIAMKIMDILGVGGSFSEFYALDLDDDIVLLGHDGPAHAGIAEGKVKIIPLPVYHGKPGQGLSIQMSVKKGKITAFSVVQDIKGQVKLLFSEGVCVAGPVLEIGNTNSRYRFSIGAKDFLRQWSEKGPAHHMAIGTGHIGGIIEKLASLLKIGSVKIGN